MAKYEQLLGSPVDLNDAFESGFLVVEREVNGCSIFERIFDAAKKALGLGPEGQLLLFAACLCAHCSLIEGKYTFVFWFWAPAALSGK